VVSAVNVLHGAVGAVETLIDGLELVVALGLHPLTSAPPAVRTAASATTRSPTDIATHLYH
jgi:hypothetical protein